MNSHTPRTAAALSGVSEEPVIALRPGQPLLSAAATNQLLLRHGLQRALARALVQEAVAATIPLSLEEERALMAREVQAQGLRSNTELEPWLLERGWTEADLCAIACHAERLRRWCAWRFQDEVEVRFLDRKRDLDRVVYSLLRVKERELAEELHQRLQTREMDFADAVRRYGTGPERYSRGLVGPVALSACHPALRERLVQGREGQLWGPVLIEEHWLVLQLEQLLPAQLNATTRTQLLQDLFADWLEHQVERLLQGEALATVPAADQDQRR
ncbi:MAG: hypothetical protein RLZZ611_2389 [Cyanobacteriota bacterium]